MTIVHSQWKARAVVSVALFFAVCVVHGQSTSALKDSFQKKVTIVKQNVSFETVLDDLSRQTKLYFIYSPNAVEANRNLSLNISDQPLRSVLNILGDMMRVTFRQEGSYVIVKVLNEPKPVVPGVRETQKRSTNVNPPTQDIELAPLESKTYSKIDHDFTLPYELLKKNLLSCAPEFKGIDTSAVKKQFPLTITNPRPRRHLYTSVGLLMNDYAGGAEIRVGMPSVYAVFNSGLMKNGYLRNGFGLGTSIPVKDRVYLNPIYTFARIKQVEDYMVDENIGLVLNDGLKVTGGHHQLKFLFQVQVTNRFSLHVGPSVNLLKAQYTYPKDIILYNSFVSVATTGAYAAPSEIRLIRNVYYTPPPDHSVMKSWVGFEAGISYSIKFFRR